jgi:hypothetical protein
MEPCLTTGLFSGRNAPKPHYGTPAFRHALTPRPALSLLLAGMIHGQLSPAFRDGAFSCRRAGWFSPLAPSLSQVDDGRNGEGHPMLPRRAMSDLVVGLLVLVTVLGTALTNWLVDVVDQTSASFLHDLVVGAGAGLAAFVGVALYELLIAPWHP